jgi:acyl carrier protein
MMDADLRSAILSVIREQLDAPNDRITPAASFIRDLGADSLSLIELALALESKFDVDIAVEDVARIGTVAEAIDYVEARVKQRG